MSLVGFFLWLLLASPLVLGEEPRGVAGSCEREGGGGGDCTTAQPHSLTTGPGAPVSSNTDGKLYSFEEIEELGLFPDWVSPADHQTVPLGPMPADQDAPMGTGDHDFVYTGCNAPGLKCVNNSTLDEATMFARGHKKPFGFHRPPDGVVASLPFMISPEDFHYHYVSRHIPVVFKGVGKHSPAFNKWTDEYLREKLGDLKVRLEYTNDDKFKFPDSRPMKDFLDQYQNRSQRLYLVDEVPVALHGDMVIPHCVRCDEMSDKFFVTYMFMSYGKSTSKFHIDTDENVLTVLKGRKKTYLVHPRFSADLHADNTKQLGVADVDPNEVDLEKYPRVKDVRYVVAYLEEGDMLYIPQNWWHQVRSISGRNQAVAMWWKSRPPVIPEIAERIMREDPLTDLEKYSFSAKVKAYEEYVYAVRHNITRLSCKNQAVPMSAYRFATDKNDKGEDEKGDEDEDEFCQYDMTNPRSPCYFAGCDQEGEDARVQFRCTKYSLDYCYENQQDPMCTLQLTLEMTKLTPKERRHIFSLPNEYAANKATTIPAIYEKIKEEHRQRIKAAKEEFAQKRGKVKYTGVSDEPVPRS